MVMYGSGLRVSEACALCFDDIDSARNVLRVREGKGGHDRYTLLGAPLLAALRAYWKKRRPPGPLLFPGPDPTRPITRKAIEAAVRGAAKSAGLRKRVSPHTLRHCFATHHQDPDFAGCEANAGARSGETFLECVGQLGVADQRGFCGGNSDYFYGDETGPCSAAPSRDICADLNE